MGNPAATTIIPGIIFNNNGANNFYGAAAAYDNDHSVIVDALITSGASAILNCPTFTNYTSLPCFGLLGYEWQSDNARR